MPPSSVRFNGSVNLPDGETVMREISTRIPSGVRRMTDGETGDRGYHPDDQAEGTTATQIEHVDAALAGREWGICTECGMGRANAEDVPRLPDLHREILAGSA